MLVSVNTVFRSTLVVLAATLLILPLIRTADNPTKVRKDTRKVEEFLEVVNKTANNSQDCIEANWTVDFDSIQIPESALSDPINVLNLLLPGKVLKDPISDETMIAWSCAKCTSSYLHNPIAEWFDIDSSITFPFNKNYTSFIGQIDLQSKDSMPQRLFSFSTSSEAFGEGRFAGGVLGLLLLEKESAGNWRVKSLNPAVMYQGSFGKAAGLFTVLNSKDFGNILVLNCPSIEATDIEGCNSYVEDSYLIDGNNLDLITRIPRAQKICREASPIDALLDFPIWTMEMKLVPMGKSSINLELNVEGMYMVTSELSENWQYMGLLHELPSFLRKKFPDKFKQSEISIADGPIAKSESLLAEDSTTTADSKEPVSLKAFFIPYKAKIGSQISISTSDGKMTVAPWKIQLESK